MPDEDDYTGGDQHTGTPPAPTPSPTPSPTPTPTPTITWA